MVKLDVTQSNFLNVLKEEIVDESHDVLLLTGSAGTGKTQIIKEAIDYCKDNGIASQCLAFTGRAASVLRERGIRSAKTIDSWFFNIARTETIENLKNSSDSFVLFIDEASMISNGAIIFENKDPELDFKLDEIVFTSLRYLPFKRILFVFVGDESQLPPLKHSQVPALDQKYFKTRYNLKARKVTLNKIYRQMEGSGILNLADKFKKNDTQEEIYIPKTEDIKTNAEFIDDKDVLNVFFDHYVENPDQIKIITSTNQLADTYNYEIKYRLSSASNSYFKDYQIANKYLAPEVGDKLQVFKNYNTQYDLPLYNGQFIEVKKLGSVEEFILTNQKGGVDEFYLPFLYQNLLIDIIDQDGKQTGNPFEIILSIDHLINSYNLTKEEFDSFDKDGDDLLSQAREAIAKETGNRRIFINKQFNPVLCKYGYAITGHKSQGGGWQNIIIDFSGFSDETGHLPPTWIYTAITRAKTKLYIVNYPEELND